MSNVKELLNFAINKKPTEFADAFEDLISEKMAAALENRKIELAQNLYNENTSPEDEDEDYDYDDYDDNWDEDFEFEDEDFDDLDSGEDFNDEDQ